jgi:hypothetical protein
MLDNSLVNQGNTGLNRFAATPSTKPMTLNSAAMNPQGQYTTGSGTGIASVSKASPGTSGQSNDMSMTNSYLNALKTQQGATAAAQSLSGMPTPDANPPETQWTPEQQKMFQSMMGQSNGLNAVSPQPPMPTQSTQGSSFYSRTLNPPTTTALPNPNPMMAGDTSRFANDPFKTNVNALR